MTLALVIAPAAPESASVPPFRVIAAPVRLGCVRISVPLLTVNAPVKVLGAERVQVPLPSLASDTPLLEPFAISPLISAVPDVEPLSVIVMPDVVTVEKGRVRTRWPVPACSNLACVFSSNSRSEASPVPVYFKVAPP